MVFWVYSTTVFEVLAFGMYLVLQSPPVHVSTLKPNGSLVGLGWVCSSASRYAMYGTIAFALSYTRTPSVIRRSGNCDWKYYNILLIQYIIA